MSQAGTRHIPFYVLNSFTGTPYHGNPAGVFLDADGLSEAQIRAMTGEIGLESAFVAGDAARGWTLRYATAATEVSLCGHATIAAATALIHAGRLKSGEDLPFTCPAGELLAGTSEENGSLLVHLRQAAPQFGPSATGDDVLEIANSLSVTPRDLHPMLPIEVVSTGSRWLCAGLAKPAMVAEAKPDLALITELSRRFDVYGIYVFALDTRAEEEAPFVHSRCFAPIAGLNEDPVTGSASGAIGCYLAKYGALANGRSTFIIEQGVGGGRSGRVSVNVQRNADGQPTGVTITGTAVLVAEGTMLVP